MPQAAVLAPVVVPMLAAGVVALFGLVGVRLGRAATGAGGAGAVLALLTLWLPVRSTQELNLGALGFGSSLDLRVDAAAFAVGLIIAVPTAILLAVQRRTWQQGAAALLGLAAALAAVEAGGLVLTALAGGLAATLALLQFDLEGDRPARLGWSALLSAWLALTLAGVFLQVAGGTTAYGAVPVESFTGPIFSLVAVAALLASGLAPWRAWPSKVWTRRATHAAGLAAATLYPLGFYLLVRAYEMGNGQYPGQAFGVGLSVLGVLVAGGAALRAQGASTRQEFLAEVPCGFGGFALMTLALGTPLGLAASLITLATGGVLTACIALLAGGARQQHFLLAVAAAVGLPPGLAFGARVLGLESTFEGGDLLGLIAIGGAVAWAVWVLGAARSVGLPAGSSEPVESSPRVATALAALTLIAGPALPALLTALANPAQADVMPAPAVLAGGGLVSVATVSTVLPALTLFAPLLLIGLAAYYVAGRISDHGGSRAVPFRVPYANLGDRVVAAIRAATVPEEYQSLWNARRLEAVVAAGRPVLWLAAVAALVFAVTRP